MWGPSVKVCSAIAGIAALAACSGASAATAPVEPNVVLPPVTASAARDPVEKSYRKMIRGMELFERMRAMAPGASLRFKLLPRRHDTDMNGIVLEILGDTFAMPVAVAADHTFMLERHQWALDEDASVTPNRRARSMTWRTEIRSPGVPTGMRRLGDMRLECLVGLEADLISNPRSLFGRFARLLTGPFEYCNNPRAQYLFFAERPLFSVSLIDGQRRETISVDRLYGGASADPDYRDDLPYCDCEVLLDRTYFLPLGDKSWSDETLVAFEYMDAGDVR
jgi:hypothetical protein